MKEGGSEWNESWPFFAKKKFGLIYRLILIKELWKLDSYREFESQKLKRNKVTIKKE